MMATAEPQVPAVDPLVETTAALPVVGARDRGRASATLPRLQPGSYLAIQDGAEYVVIGLGEAPMRVGRSPAADVVIDDASVSRRHAMVVRRAGRTVLLDDRSRNGISVNGVRTSEAVLSDGDEIVLGRVTLRYVEVAAAAA